MASKTDYPGKALKNLITLCQVTFMKFDSLNSFILKNYISIYYNVAEIRSYREMCIRDRGETVAEKQEKQYYW